MSTNIDFDEKEVEKLLENAGKSKSTLAQQRQRQAHLMSFLEKSGCDPECLKNGTFWNNAAEVENQLIRYFSTLRKKNGELPKTNTFEGAKSRVKTMILDVTKGAVDISRASVFPKLSKFFKGNTKKLKGAGKRDTDSYESLTDHEMERIYKILGTLLNLMELDRNDPTFEENLNVLPEKFCEDYHYLAMYGAIFIVIFFVSTE